MTDAQAAQELAEIAAELGAAVCLDPAQGEGDGVQESWKGPADGGRGVSL